MILFLASITAAQKIAVIAPEKSVQTDSFSENLESNLTADFKILDDSLSATAFRSAEFTVPFNLTKTESKLAGKIIGCDFFVLLKIGNQRRAALAKADYYEAFAVIYIISSRTGRLVFWKLESRQAAAAKQANANLIESAKYLAEEISAKIKAAAKEESSEKPAPKIEELPAENSPETKNFRPPLPYKRIKPKYTALANLYSIEAVVEIEIDVDENGTITRGEIVRWAGYGLDESVAETVRKMNWRAAERSGKFLPMRVLLRYNFKKIEAEE